MRIRFVLYGMIVLLAALFYFHAWQPQLEKRYFPGIYCRRFSGRASYAWGQGQADRCSREGCVVHKIREFDDPMKLDDDGYTFRCRSK